MVENKKNPKADLTRTTGLFLNVGLVISLLLVIFAFEKKMYDDGSLVNLNAQAEDFEDLMDIPQTQQPPPPPPKKVQPEIIEVPDEEEIEEEIEIDLDVEMT
ncbi:MAG: energy transducer TonB, partial [Cyclobacteriaceae bacterium]|nr:energy transducer TonB [Cyclobacteriaceae bacterium]